MPIRRCGGWPIGCASGEDRRMADQWRVWAVAVVALAILIGALAFYVLVVNAPIDKPLTGPIPSLQR
jgi:hypothetical protein